MMKPVYLFFLLVFVVPGVTGGILAANRARNVFVWSLLSAVFPIFLLVIYFHKPLREVEGKFRRCGGCGEFIPWRETACRYCGREQSAPP